MTEPADTAAEIQPSAAETTAAVMPAKPLSLWDKVTRVRLVDRAEAFLAKHPYAKTALAVGAAGVLFSMAIGLPAVAAGAYTLGASFGLALEFGALTAFMGGVCHLAKGELLPAKPKTLLLPSGQVIAAKPALCAEIKTKQRQFDNISLRRDFNVKSELTARDRGVLQAYEALWQDTKADAWIKQRFTGAAEVISVVSNDEIAKVTEGAALVGAFLKNNFGRSLALPALTAEARAYADADLAKSARPEVAIRFGKKLHLAETLAKP